MISPCVKLSQLVLHKQGFLSPLHFLQSPGSVKHIGGGQLRLVSKWNRGHSVGLERGTRSGSRFSSFCGVQNCYKLGHVAQARSVQEARKRGQGLTLWLCQAALYSGFVSFMWRSRCACLIGQMPGSPMVWRR